MRWIIITAAALAVTACATTPAPMAGNGPGRWYLYVPPAPHAEMAPQFSMNSWVKQDAFQDTDDCLTARSALHLQAMQSNQDLAMRALEGVCFNPDQAQIVR